MYDCAEDDIRDNHHERDTGDPLAAATMSGPIKKVYACQWIKTEPVEENETSDVFHQFQSEPVDKSERKGDIIHESLTGVGLPCGQMSTENTQSLEQSQITSSKVKLEPFTDSESNSSRDAEPVYFSDSEIKVEFEDDSEIDPDQASTSFPVNKGVQADINNCLQSEEATDSNMTVTGDAVKSDSISVTSMEEDEDKSSGDEQEYDEPCATVHQDPGSNKSADSVTTTPRPFVCDVCEKCFAKKCILKTHKLTHSDIKQFECDVCHKSFKHSHHLTEHKLTHSGIIQYVCDVCHKGFKTSRSLTSHKLIHSDIKQFVCDVCEKAFTKKVYLKTHKLIHSNIKQYVCELCHKSFKQRGYLTQHKLTHSDIKQFVCDVCHKSFKHSGSLRQHKLTHTDIRPFVCDVCEKGFTKKICLKTHKLIHSDIKQYVCELCHKSFKQRCHLTQHMLTHSDIKQFECDVCHKSFKHSGSLRHHKLTHTDIRSFVCDVCHKGFKRSSSLTHHKLIYCLKQSPSVTQLKSVHSGDIIHYVSM